MAAAMVTFLAGLDEADRRAFERVSAVVARVAPAAEQGTSYGMPAYRVGGRPLLGFGAAKGHLSLFPFSPAAIDAVRDRLDGFDLGKGTLRFTAEHPVPEDVLADLLRERLAEIAR